MANINQHHNVINEKNQRIIRSYVLRQGRITPAQRLAIDRYYATHSVASVVPLAFSPLKAYILEIGFGAGDSLLAQAKAYPEYHFLGIEVHKPGVGHLWLQLEKANITNVDLFCEDAVNVLQHQVSDNSIDKMQIFFPDPWPKKKHHKRRLIQVDFIKLIYQKLKPNGILHIATDWADYATYSQQLILSSNLFVLSENVFIPRFVTKFEQRGIKLGHKIQDLIFSAQ